MGMLQPVVARWRSAARSDIGKVRARNEDSFVNLAERGLWLVADGMGGHRDGALASRLIAESLSELPFEALSLAERTRHAQQCLHWLNRRFSDELTLLADRNLDPVMGSTVVALLADGQQLSCLWAGDSRCYLLRNRQLYQLSRDHCLARELVEQQQVDAQTAAKHPQAQVLTQAIGAASELKLEMLELEALPGDVYLLCSDGLYQYLTPAQLCAALASPSPEQALERLFAQVLSGPARDNLSAVVLHYGGRA